MNIEQAFRKAIQYYRGLPEKEMLCRVGDFFQSEVVHKLLPGAMRIFEHHRQLGHPLVIVTNGSRYQASMAAKAWKMDDYIANTFMVDDQGRLTGKLISPMCYGAGKLRMARNWADQRGIDLENSYFYTDSYSDLPLLQAVGYPRVVNPDPKLRHLCRKQQWSVLDWS